jgi:hypothetical protein
MREARSCSRGTFPNAGPRKRRLRQFPPARAERSLSEFQQCGRRSLAFPFSAKSASDSSRTARRRSDRAASPRRPRRAIDRRRITRSRDETVVGRRAADRRAAGRPRIARGGAVANRSRSAVRRSRRGNRSRLGPSERPVWRGRGGCRSRRFGVSPSARPRSRFARSSNRREVGHARARLPTRLRRGGSRKRRVDPRHPEGGVPTGGCSARALQDARAKTRLRHVLRRSKRLRPFLIRTGSPVCVVPAAPLFRRFGYDDRARWPHLPSRKWPPNI